MRPSRPPYRSAWIGAKGRGTVEDKVSGGMPGLWNSRWAQEMTLVGSSPTLPTLEPDSLSPASRRGGSTMGLPRAVPPSLEATHWATHWGTQSSPPRVQDQSLYTLAPHRNSSRKGDSESPLFRPTVTPDQRDPSPVRPLISRAPRRERAVATFLDLPQPSLTSENRKNLESLTTSAGRPSRLKPASPLSLASTRTP
jgi:hypothetical protein